jgi:hypothetical protein
MNLDRSLLGSDVRRSCVEMIRAKRSARDMFRQCPCKLILERLAIHKSPNLNRALFVFSLCFLLLFGHFTTPLCYYLKKSTLFERPRPEHSASRLHDSPSSAKSFRTNRSASAFHRLIDKHLTEQNRLIRDLKGLYAIRCL